jgi:hypothetical protein
LGVLKSSGIIIATGSGSTGLLMSARRPTISELCDSDQILNDSRGLNTSEFQLKKMYDDLSFRDDSRKFYYFNRELCRNPSDYGIYERQTLLSLRQKEEGFCRDELIIQNLNFDGTMLADGNRSIKLQYGDLGK